MSCFFKATARTREARLHMRNPLEVKIPKYKTMIAFFSSFLIMPTPSMGVSGGGLDYATSDIRGRDFTSQTLIKNDFTQCDATAAKFIGAKLMGSRFYRANLREADFSNADLSGASLEDTLLADSIFSDAILKGAYLSPSILDAKNIANADFTDAQMPDKVRRQLCSRDDVSNGGVNKNTQISTSESLFCE